MDNYQKSLTKSKFFSTASTSDEKASKVNRIRKNKNAALSIRSQARIENWVTDNEASTKIYDILLNGSIPLVDPTKHNFRDREKLKEIDSKGVTVKNFVSSKDRADIEEKRYKESFLERDIYDPDLPFKNPNSYLRLNEMEKQGFPMRFGINNRTENENIVKSIENFKYIDHQGKNNKMIHLPEWKTDNKEKWVDDRKRNFVTSNFSFSGPRYDPPWKQIPIRLSSAEPYVDGFENIGDVSRKREKKKEGKRTEFVSTLAKDLWENTLKISHSTRTHISDNALNMDENYDLYSTNKKIGSYKNALLESKSVDRLIPFEHSVNKQSDPMRDIRPVSKKIYNNSVKEILSKNKGKSYIMNYENDSIKEIKEKHEDEKKMSIKPPLTTVAKKTKISQYLTKEEKVKIALENYFGKHE